MPNRPALLLAPSFLVLAVLLAVPLVILLASSLDTARQPGPLAFEFTTEHYETVFNDWYYLEMLGRTALVSAMVTLFCLVFGYLLAIRLWLATPRGRVYLMLIVVAPLLVSIVARTYGWLLVMGDRGLINTTLLNLGLIEVPLRMLYNDAAVVMGLAHLFTAFAVLSIHASLERIEWEVVEAGLVAGAGYWTIFRTILLPLSLPGLVVGATLVFSLSMSAYITPALMGGNQSAMATLIYQKFLVTFDWHGGAVLAVALLLAGLAGVLLIILGGMAFGRRRPEPDAPAATLATAGDGP